MIFIGITVPSSRRTKRGPSFPRILIDLGMLDEVLIVLPAKENPSIVSTLSISKQISCLISIGMFHAFLENLDLSNMALFVSIIEEINSGVILLSPECIFNFSRTVYIMVLLSIVFVISNTFLRTRIFQSRQELFVLYEMIHMHLLC